MVKNILRIAGFGLLAGCGSPLVTEATTSGGTWDVSLASGEYAQGDADLLLTVERGESEILEITLDVGMPGMRHDVPRVTLVPDGAAYAGTGPFEMAGLWELDGIVRGSAGEETFGLVVEVR